jgi:hypothetical protein
MKKYTALLLSVCLLGVTTSASAQLGGLGPKVPKLGGGSASPAVDIDAYINNSTETAKMMLTSVAILDYASKSQATMAELKAQIAMINDKKSPGELNAYSKTIAPQVSALNDNANAADAIKAKYQKASAQEKTLISNAVFNMAVAIPRMISLAKDGPNLIKSLGTSPANIGKIGKIKDVVEQFGRQVGATTKFVGTLPKLLGTVNVKGPSDPQTTQYKATTV